MRLLVGSIDRMLPTGFHWNKTSDRLKLREHTLIMIEPEHYPVALINIMRSCLPRRLFFSTHETAIRYSEMWSIKWEADIRLFVGNIEGADKIERISRPIGMSASTECSRNVTL